MTFIAIIMFILSFCLNKKKKKKKKKNRKDGGIYLWNLERDISFPIFIRKEIETRLLERKSKQKISRLIDLLYRLNDIISR